MTEQGVFTGVEVLEHVGCNYASIKLGSLGSSHFVCVFRVFTVLFTVFIQTRLIHLQCFQKLAVQPVFHKFVISLEESCIECTCCMKSKLSLILCKKKVDVFCLNFWKIGCLELLLIGPRMYYMKRTFGISAQEWVTSSIKPSNLNWCEIDFCEYNIPVVVYNLRLISYMPDRLVAIIVY